MGNLGWKREKKDRNIYNGDVDCVCPECEGNGGHYSMDIDTGDMTWTYCDRCGGSGWIELNNVSCTNSKTIESELSDILLEQQLLYYKIKEIKKRIESEKDKVEP